MKMNVNASELDAQLVQRLMCPLCEGTLRHADPPADGDMSACCVQCGAFYPQTGGVWRMLTETEQERYGSFLHGYPQLREREGWERDKAYFLALPNVPPSDPAAFVWKIRRRGLAILDQILSEQRVQTHPDGSEEWALDLGAGNGWLARHLTQQGYRTVALDLTVGGLDSLAGAELYVKHDGIWLGRVQASMSRPPLRDASFSLCTISGALHYADLAGTLNAVYRILRPGGLLVISDSPIYSTPEAGDAMYAEWQAKIEALLQDQAPTLPGGRNFLVEAELLTCMKEVGFSSVRTFSVERPLGRLKRSMVGRFAGVHREEARFPVTIGSKPFLGRL